MILFKLFNAANHFHVSREGYFDGQLQYSRGAMMYLASEYEMLISTL
jgi:hypothetical protein